MIEKICDRVGIIIEGKMVVEGAIKQVCGERTLEDTFFDIYKNTMGDKAV